jgi:hypothetical protein
MAIISSDFSCVPLCTCSCNCCTWYRHQRAKKDIPTDQIEDCQCNCCKWYRKLREQLQLPSHEERVRRGLPRKEWGDLSPGPRRHIEHPSAVWSEMSEIMQDSPNNPNRPRKITSKDPAESRSNLVQQWKPPAPCTYHRGKTLDPWHVYLDHCIIDKPFYCRQKMKGKECQQVFESQLLLYKHILEAEHDV